MSDHPAAWATDPSGRHHHRYWDGTCWTEHVADAGVASVDPYYATPAPSAPPAADELRAEGIPEPTPADTLHPVGTDATRPEWATSGPAALEPDAPEPVPPGPLDVEPAGDDPVEPAGLVPAAPFDDEPAGDHTAEPTSLGDSVPAPLPTTMFPPTTTAWPASPGFGTTPAGPRAPAPPPPYVASSTDDGAPPTGASTKRWLVIAGIAAVILLIVVAAVAASGGGDDKVDARQLRADLASKFRMESDISEAQAACKADIYIEDVGPSALGGLDLTDPDAQPPANLVDELDAADARATDECNIVTVPPFESSTTTEGGLPTPTSIGIGIGNPGSLPPDYEKALANAYVQTFGLTEEKATCLAHAVAEAIRTGEITDSESASGVLKFLTDCDISLDEVSAN